MRKIACFTFAVLMAVSLLAACAPAVPETVIESASSKPINLKVGVMNYISNAPFFIAQQEGYFAEQGLNVELVDFGSASSEIIPALASRQLDAAATTLSAGVFNAILDGNDLKYVADKGFINPDNCITDAWVAGKNALTTGVITDVVSIKGKNAVFPPGGTTEYAFDQMLKQADLTQSDVNISNVQDSAARIEGLKNGSIDVSMLSEPWITRAQTAGAGEVWIPLSKIVPNLSYGAVVFGPGILDDKPDAATRFMTAYLKAVKQFNEGKTNRNVEIIAAFTKLPEEDIRASCWTSFQPDGKMNTGTLIDFEAWALEKGYINGPLKIDQYWTSQFIDEAFAILNK